MNKFATSIANEMLLTKLKSAKKKKFLLIIALLIYIVAGCLCVIWFGWKLLVVLILFTWANNINIFIEKLLPINEKVMFLYNYFMKQEDKN